MKILIAEDDFTSRIILAKVLKNRGHEVIETTNGLEAWEAMQQPNTAKIVILDWMMPGMSGIEVCRSIRTIETDHPPYLIILTTKLAKQDIVAGLEAGADDYLAKPYNPAELQARIEVGCRMVAMQAKLVEKLNELESLHNKLQHQYDVASQVFSKIMQTNERLCGNVKYFRSSMETTCGDIALSVLKPSGGIYAFLGDFTGHGLSAAIGAVPVADIFFAMTKLNCSICDIAAEINAKLMKMLPTGMFLAACLLDLEFSTGTLTVWNGGIPDVLVIGHQGEIKNRIPSDHLPLGIINNNKLDLHVDQIEIEQDDRIYVYSDGVIETRNSDMEMFGQQRLEQHFQKGPLFKSVLETINTSLEAFRADTPQEDDITMIEIVCNAETAGNIHEVDISNDREGPRSWNL